VRTVLAFLKNNWSMPGIGLTIFIAWLLPDIGQYLSNVGAKTIAIVLIFLLSGIAVETRAIVGDVLRWRVHLFVQVCSFVAIPLIVVASTGWMGDGSIKYGVFLVAAVPTTIASCVVFTTLAGGRTACALLNAVVGNVIGIIITPLLLAWMMGRGNGMTGLNPAKTIQKLALMVLLPFVAGQIVAYLAPFVRPKIKPIKSILSQSLILIIMLCAFSAAFGKLDGKDLGALGKCFAYLTGLHLFLLGGVLVGGGLMRLPRDERCALFFCAPQKTLAMGLAVAATFFQGVDGVSLGLVTLPLVYYHFFQLVMGTLLIPMWKRGQSEG
jgi:solute carrier family 10 (sodium/bile acid cotransporter), member 7